MSLFALASAYLPLQARTASLQEGNDMDSKYRQAANVIRTKYDHNFIKLSTSAQNHYAVRMYRLTGEDYYAQQSGHEIFQIHDRLNHYLKHINDVNWRQQQAQKMIDLLPKTPRGKLRKQAFSDTGDKRFILHLLYQLAKLKEYGLKHPGHDVFMPYLTEAKLDRLLFRPDFIKAYAAQVANYVYWLKSLDIVDWREQIRPAFARAYPDHQDATLSASAFNNKLYGLTHIILADSHYYQRPVDASDHQWILDYFLLVLPRIASDSKPDIHAEIGLCFLLTQQKQSPVLAKMQTLIYDAIDWQKQMVLSTKGSDRLSLGEHRNVLAYALLNWPETLYQGPYLQKKSPLKQSLPLVYQ
ncbi:DUF3541 domain-containing protein [Thalassotalea aquiviva]|uniref:DUF3541 domain-containing protein n=1 Tax=Thalassotalea aquiviva TaxID=3242415 RepID=UPI003529E0D8